MHILIHGCSLHKERGQLVMRCDGAGERSCALEDLRAVVIAARGVSLSSDLVSALCRNNTVILHCDEKYCPCGVTAPLAHTTRAEVLKHQCALNSASHRRLWERIVTDKVENQARALQLLGAAFGIPRKSGATVPDESAAARFYWKSYFQHLQMPEEVRDRDNGTPINNMLNYGYAVLSALVHRSVVAHGMLPEIGFHHQPHFAGYPLVYDLMEPFRPFVDVMLAGFWSVCEDNGERRFRAWCKAVAQALLDIRLETPCGKLKLLYALDVYAESIAGCLEENSIRSYWSPILEKQSFQNGLDHDDVRSAGDDGGGT